MTISEYDDYYVPAAEKVLGVKMRLLDVTDWQNTCLAFEKLIGIDEFKNYFETPVRDLKPMPDDTKRLLSLLASEHSKTILKMINIKNKS